MVTGNAINSPHDLPGQRTLLASGHRLLHGTHQVIFRWPTLPETIHGLLLIIIMALSHDGFFRGKRNESHGAESGACGGRDRHLHLLPGQA